MQGGQSAAGTGKTSTAKSSHLAIYQAGMLKPGKWRRLSLKADDKAAVLLQLVAQEMAAPAAEILLQLPPYF